MNGFCLEHKKAVNRSLFDSQNSWHASNELQVRNFKTSHSVRRFLAAKLQALRRFTPTRALLTPSGVALRPGVRAV